MAKNYERKVIECRPGEELTLAVKVLDSDWRIAGMVDFLRVDARLPSRDPNSFYVDEAPYKMVQIILEREAG